MGTSDLFSYWNRGDCCGKQLELEVSSQLKFKITFHFQFSVFNSAVALGIAAASFASVRAKI